MRNIIDKDWIAGVRRVDPALRPVIVETDLWSQAFAEVSEVCAWRERMGRERMVVTHATVREIMFGAHWLGSGEHPDPAFEARLRDYAESLAGTHPYLPSLDPGLIWEVERLRADPRLKNLWIDDMRCRKPRSPGRIEIAGAALYLGLPIASRGLAAYRHIAACGYPLTLVYDPVTGTEAVRDGQWFAEPASEPA